MRVKWPLYVGGEGLAVLLPPNSSGFRITQIQKKMVTTQTSHDNSLQEGAVALCFILTGILTALRPQKLLFSQKDCVIFTCDQNFP